MSLASAPVNPLRVLQEDSVHLDRELSSLLCSKLRDAVKYFPSLTHESVELKALVHFLLLFQHSLTHGGTYGMKVLDLKHHCSRNGPGHVSRTRHLLLTLLCTSDEALTVYGKSNASRLALWRCLSVAFHLCSIVNFFKFLRSSDYVTLWHRLTGVRIMSEKPRFVRPLTFEFTNRELLWHTFSEFMSFLLPIVDFSQLKRNFFQIIKFKASETHRPKRALTGFVCHLCLLPPVIPYNGRCSHVFCYVCLFRLVKTGEKCPTCEAHCDLIEMVPCKSI